MNLSSLEIAALRLAVILMLIFSASASAVAQGRWDARESGPPPTGKADVFQSVKEDLQQLMRENESLIPQYERLKNQYMALQEMVHEDRQEVLRLKEIPETPVAPVEDIASLQNAVLLLESKNAYAKTGLLDLEERQELLNLKLADLQYAQRDLKVESKLKEYQAQQAKDEQRAALGEMEDRLAVLLAKDKELMHLLKEVEHQIQLSPETSARLQAENEVMRREVNELRERIAFKQKVTQHLEDKRQYKIRTMELHLQDKEELRSKLQTMTERLQARYDQLEEHLKSSLAKREQNKELMEDVIEIDRENQELRDNIQQLQQNIKKLQ